MFPSRVSTSMFVFQLFMLKIASQSINCINFCLQWDDSVVDDPNSDLEMVQLPEITCPMNSSGITNDEWNNLNDDILNDGDICECGLSS